MAPSSSESEEQRVNLKLGIEGVAPHAELLLKSLVRLLNYRTEHNWSFGTGTVDLRVIGEGAPEFSRNQALSNVLWVGDADNAHYPLLRFPIHAQELEHLLNMLGASIVQGRQTAQSPTQPIAPNEIFKLRRWPPTSILGSRTQIRLATLMASQPISLQTLVLKSGASQHDCQVFCQDLDRAGMLQRHGMPAASHPDGGATPDQAGAAAGRADLSLLSRLRRRLGL